MKILILHGPNTNLLGLWSAKNNKNIVKVKELKNKGDLIVFPSHAWHRVKQVTEGKRLSLVLWFIGPPFK